MVKKSIFIAHFLTITAVFAGVDSQQENLHVYAIPAADKTGCKTDRLQEMYGKEATVTQVPLHMDFGQWISQRKLNGAIESASCRPGVLHGACAGTATALLYAANGKYKDKLEGVICMGPLASFNAAVPHRIERAAELPVLNIKCLDRFIAATANTFMGKYVYPQVLFPMGYFAFRESVLEAAPKIKNKEMPIVIVAQHANDHAVPASQSHALYYALKNNGFTNAYLMKPNNADHVDLIDPNGAEAAAINRIVRGLATEEDRTLYMPAHEQFEDTYKSLITHDRKVRAVSAITTSTVVCAAALLARKVIRTRFA